MERAGRRFVCGWRWQRRWRGWGGRTAARRGHGRKVAPLGKAMVCLEWRHAATTPLCPTGGRKHERKKEGKSYVAPPQRSNNMLRLGPAAICVSFSKFNFSKRFIS